jgi:hypothetical protein
MPYQAMGDLFGKTVSCDGGGAGDDEQLLYHENKYCASEPAEPNSCFCILFF